MSFGRATRAACAASCLMLLCATIVQSKAGNKLVESKFYTDAEGWTIEGEEVPGGGKVNHDGANAKISVADTKDNAWFWVAPEKFTGDQSPSYNGKLVFTLGHFYYNTDEKKPIEADADVILESLCEWTLTIKMFKPHDMAEEYSITLNENSGWTDSRTGGAPTLWDFIGMLSNIKSLKIRGGYYKKEEMTNLGNVYLLEGTAWKPCCNAKSNIDYCAVPGSPFFNPPDLKFYCLGHDQKEVKITKIEPRYARKSGGATLTVFGQNFGLKHSEPIVKVDDKPCTRQWIEVEGELVKCIVPPKKSDSDGEDVAVTVSAHAYTHDHEFESTATNCISAEARKFTYFGHDVVWYKHLSPTVQDQAPREVAESFVIINSVAANRNTGAVYVTGTYDHEAKIADSGVTLPAPAKEHSTTPHFAGTNIFVVKWGNDRHKPNGEANHFRWAHSFGHLSKPALNEGVAVAVDEMRDEVIFVGQIEGKDEQAKFPVGTTYDSHKPDPNVPVNVKGGFACKLDGKGDVKWVVYMRQEAPSLTRDLHEASANHLIAWAVSVFRGNVYVTGYGDEMVADPKNFYIFGNDKVGLKKIPSRDYTQKFAWIASFNQADGAPRFATWADFGSQYGEVYGKAIDVYKGSIFIAGWFYHTVTSSTLKFYRPEGVDSDGIKLELTANQECYIAEYNLDGTPLRAVASSGTQTQTGCQIMGIAAMRTFINVAGRFYADGSSSVSFGKDSDGASIETGKTSSLSDYDAFLLQYQILRDGNPTQNLLPTWIKKLTNAGVYDEQWEGVAVDEYYSEIYVSGTFGADIRMPYHAEVDRQLRIGTDGQKKACAAKYSVTGQEIWAKSFKASGPWQSDASAIAVIDTDAYIVGKFENSVMMDNSDNVLTAAGKWDSWIAKLED